MSPGGSSSGGGKETRARRGQKRGRGQRAFPPHVPGPVLGHPRLRKRRRRRPFLGERCRLARFFSFSPSARVVFARPPAVSQSDSAPGQTDFGRTAVKSRARGRALPKEKPQVGAAAAARKAGKARRQFPGSSGDLVPPPPLSARPWKKRGVVRAGR